MVWLWSIYMRSQGIPWERIYSKRGGVTELELRAMAHDMGVRVDSVAQNDLAQPHWIDLRTLTDGRVTKNIYKILPSQ